MGKNKILYGVQYLLFMLLIIALVLEIKIPIIVLTALNGVCFFFYVGSTFKLTDSKEKKAIRYVRELELDVQDSFKNINNHLDSISRTLNIFQNSIGIMDDIKMLSENLLIKTDNLKALNQSSNHEILEIIDKKNIDTLKELTLIFNKYDFEKLLININQNIELLQGDNKTNHVKEMETIEKFIEIVGNDNKELKEILEKAYEEIVITKNENNDKYCSTTQELKDMIEKSAKETMEGIIIKVEENDVEEKFAQNLLEVKDELEESLKEVLENTDTSIDNIKSEIVEEFSKISEVLEVMNKVKDTLVVTIENNNRNVINSINDLEENINKNLETTIDKDKSDNNKIISEILKENSEGIAKLVTKINEKLDLLSKTKSVKDKEVNEVKNKGISKIVDDNGIKYVLGDKVLKYEEKDGTTTEFKYKGNEIEQSKIKKHGDLVMVVNFNNGNIVEAKHYSNGSIVNKYIYNEQGELVDSIEYNKDIVVNLHEDKKPENIQDTIKVKLSN